MEIECILKLTQCKEELLDSLEFDMISPCLIQHGVITSTEYERFRDLSSNKDKVVAFLELLPTKSLDTFTRFVKSLEEDYDWLAFSLKNTQITPQQVETYKLSQNNNKPFGDNLKPTPGISGIQARPPVSSGSGVVNDCETMSASQSSNSSVCSQDGRDRRMHQERNDRMAIERDMDQRQERERARFEQERRSRMDMDRGGMDMGRMDGGERDRDRMDMGERDRCRIEIGERDRGGMDVGERDRGRMDMGERDRCQMDISERDRGRMDISERDRGRMDMGERDRGRMDMGERDRGRMDMGERDRCRIDIGERERGRLDMGERDRGRMDMGERDRGRMDMGERDRARHEMYDRGSGYNRRQDILDRGHAQDRLERLDYLDRGYGYDRPVRGFGQEPLRHELLDRGTALDRMDRFRQDTIHRTLSQESLERLGNAGFRRMGSPIRRGLGSPLHSSSGGFGSPLHSSEFSLKSSESGEDRFESLSQVGDGKRRQEMEGEITEEMIEFVMVNPRIMKRWQNLAHSVGLSHRVEVIKARIRSEGRDHDEHVGEFLREWAEQKPEAATLGGLINLLKDQKFNDTALKLEDGTFRKRRT